LVITTPAQERTSKTLVNVVDGQGQLVDVWDTDVEDGEKASKDFKVVDSVDLLNAKSLCVFDDDVTKLLFAQEPGLQRRL